MRMVRSALAFVSGVLILAGGVLRREVRRSPFLSVVQAGGVLLVTWGIGDWSRPAAKVFLGLVVAAAAEMWMRGDADGEQRA